MHTHYEIYESGKTVMLSRYDTFEEAEMAAKYLVAGNGYQVLINMVTKTPQGINGRVVARVARDSFERIWTDITWQGASLL